MNERLHAQADALDAAVRRERAALEKAHELSAELEACRAAAVEQQDRLQQLDEQLAAAQEQQAAGALLQAERGAALLALDAARQQHDALLLQIAGAGLSTQ